MDDTEETSEVPSTTAGSRRRAAAPSRARIAANDDVPSIGGLIYALQQQPSQRPMTIAAIASGVWAVLGLLLAWAILAPEIQRAPTLLEMLARPTALTLLATILIPIALFWFLALLIWRAQELKLMSSAMTEVAIRLAEPDRMAEQQIASVGQAVRRQVSFMNDAVSRALGRAGELEALVHSEVAALERAYSENEHRIRGLIQELSGERTALVTTADGVNRTLKEIGTEIPVLVERLGQQQLKLAGFIEGAGQNLVELESTLAKSTTGLERVLGSQTERIETVFMDFTQTLGQALDQRANSMRANFDRYAGELAASIDRRAGVIEGQAERIALTFDQKATALDERIAARTEGLQSVFETYAEALDTTLARRQQAIDSQLVERTRMLDQAFTERLALFDDSLTRTTIAVDGAVADKALALTRVLEGHAQQIGNVLGAQADALDSQLLHGVSAVRKASESVTRQSIAAIEGLSAEAHKLQSISENLLGRISQVTDRFQSQGHLVQQAAGSLEAASYRIDRTLQSRQSELSQALEQLADKSTDIDRTLGGYTKRLESSISTAESRAREVGETLSRSAEQQARATLSELGKLQSAASSDADRAIDELRSKFSQATSEVGDQFGSLTNRLSNSSEEMRLKARAALADIEGEQARLRAELERLPDATRAGVETMRSTLQEQVKALQQLSSLSSRGAARRDVSPPTQLAPPQRATQIAQAPAGHDADPRMSHPAAAPAQPGTRDGWKLGDLLARASTEDEAAGHASAAEAGINVPGIVRALDATTAAAIWSRFRSGQRGIMVRSIYSSEGRIIFDEAQRRYRGETGFRGTVDRYLLDFEHVLRESDQQDPSGRLTQSYIVTDGGRVYLFLAHASGRLS